MFQDAQIFLDIKANNDTRLFHIISRRIKGTVSTFSEDNLKNLLRNQSKEASSYVSENSVLFHRRFKEVKKPTLFFFRLDTPIDLSYNGNAKLDTFIVHLSPYQDVVGHLQKLWRLTRTLKEPTITKRLQGAKDPDSVRAIFWDQTDITKAA